MRVEVSVSCSRGAAQRVLSAESDAAAEILERAKLIGAELIALGAKHKRFLISPLASDDVAKVLDKAECPVRTSRRRFISPGMNRAGVHADAVTCVTASAMGCSYDAPHAASFLTVVAAMLRGVFMIPETTNSSFHDEALHLATHNIHFSRILVGTDYSKQAGAALRMAITIGEMFGSEIFLVHAVPPFVYGEGSELMPPESLTALLDAAKDDMKKLVASEPRLQALRVQTIVDYAGGVNLIEHVVDKAKVDLIVVGSHGASGLERLVLGSTAETVLRKAVCPVLVVGPNCRVENHPFRSVLFATDLETTSLRAAQYASALAERVDGRLTLLHVVKDALRIPGVQSDVVEARFRQQVQSLLPADVELFCKPKVRLEYGSQAEVITGVAESESASLIVVGLRNRKPLAEHAPWSTLSHVIREAKCGMLGVRGHLL